MDLKAIRLEGVDEICLVQVWDQLWIFVNIAIMNGIWQYTITANKIAYQSIINSLYNSITESHHQINHNFLSILHAH
jgi:hypothetical protein